jgi:hypothetical protein
MGDTRTGSRTNLLHEPSSQKDRPTFVTVTLDPFFSGQTEKPGELRGRRRSAAAPVSREERAFPLPPPAQRAKRLDEKKREGLPSPL